MKICITLITIGILTEAIQKRDVIVDVPETQSYKSSGYVITHFSGSGFNNQIHQILNGVAFARALNRTYCLPPFVRRKSDEINSRATLTDFSEIFDIRHFRKFVTLESIENCSSLCRNRVDFIINMSPNKMSVQGYERQNTMKLMGFDSKFSELVKFKRFKNLQRSWAEWHTELQVVSELKIQREKCLELFQPFPAANLIVNGNMKILSASLQFSNSIEEKAKRIAEDLFEDSSYISVHWRYEYQEKGESKCRKKNLKVRGSGDVCFVIFLKKQRSELKDYLNFGECRGCEKYLLFVRLEDLGSALADFQTSMGGLEIYLASDAEPRVMEKLRKYIHFKTINDSKIGFNLLANESMEVLSAVEQGICALGENFIGTSYSTWTTTVWMLRSHLHGEQNRIHGFLEHLTSVKT